jgi:hypothetical protein
MFPLPFSSLNTFPEHLGGFASCWRGLECFWSDLEWLLAGLCVILEGIGVVLERLCVDLEAIWALRVVFASIRRPRQAAIYFLKDHCAGDHPESRVHNSDCEGARFCMRASHN